MILDQQLQVMTMMLAAGLVVGVNLTLYDRYILRAKSANWRWVTDGMFWCVQALFIFILLFHANGVEWRFYVLLSIICGYAAYEALIKNGVVRILTTVDRIVKAIAKFLERVITVLFISPIKWVWKLLLLSVGLVLTTICRILLFIGRIMYSPFDPFFQFIRKKAGFFAKKIKKWVNLLYNRE